MIKLTKKQQKKFDLIKEFLTTHELGKDGIMLGENDVTYIWVLLKIYKNASGIHIFGKEVGTMARKDDSIDQRDLNKLYSASRRGDEGFREFLSKEN